MKATDPSEYQLRFTRELGDLLARKAMFSLPHQCFGFAGRGICVTTHPVEGWTQMDGWVYPLMGSPDTVTHRVVVAVPYGWTARRALAPLWNTACRALALEG